MTVQDIKTYIVTYAKNASASKYFIESLEHTYNSQVSEDDISKDAIVKALSEEDNITQAKSKTKHEVGFYREFVAKLTPFAEIRFVIITDFDDSKILDTTAVLKVFR